jgi:hypothetical protein
MQALLLGLFLTSLAANIFAAIKDASLLSVPAFLLGWYVADFMSGVIHMYMDYRPCPSGKRLNDLFFYEGSRESPEYLTLLRERMTAINPFERLVYDFKNHHPRPLALGRRSLWRLIGSTIIVAALPLSLLLNVLAFVAPLPGWVMAGFIAVLIGGGFAQYFHGSLHREHNPWIVVALRKVGLLMTPAAHQKHHDTLKRDFSTNCGWSNPLVNQVFRVARARGYLDDSGLIPGP